MKVTAFIQEIAKREGLKKQQDIAQLTETTRIIRDILLEELNFDLYEKIREIKK